MKIKKIVFKNYLHFQKDLEIDLTYPEGHAKAGQPLDKVCFIGQSGTGKSTILDIIRYFVCERRQNESFHIDVSSIREDAVEIFYNVETEEWAKVSGATGQFKYIEHSRQPAKEMPHPDYEKKISPIINNLCKPLLLNFPFCVVSPKDIKQFAINPETAVDVSSGVKRTDSGQKVNKKCWDFTGDEIKGIWQKEFDKINEHKQKYLEELQKNHIEARKDKPNADIILKKFEDWAASVRNPIKRLADEVLDPILAHFKLEVETDIDKYEHKGPDSPSIIIKSKSDNTEIAFEYLSTGAKQIMLTAIPLFSIEPRNSIILFDQPETSLYPNIQLLIPEVYLKAAGDTNQFFFATHSPIVASSFDPWEVIELEFHEKTKRVHQRPYYEAKRHFDHYTINPKLLAWDSSYQVLFHTNERPNEDRTETLEELAILEQEIEKEKTKEKKKELTDRYIKLAKLLDWRLPAYEKN